MRKKISTNSNGRKDLYTRTRARIRTRIYKYARKNAQASRIKIIPPVSLAAVLVLFIAVGVTLLSAQEISGDSASGSVISNNSGSDIEARNISGSILNPQTGQTEGAEGTEGTDPAPPEGFAEASVAGVTSNQSLRSGSGRAGVENENIPVASLSINSSVGTISGSFLNESGSGSIAESQAASGDLISSLSISSSAKAYSGAILSSDSPVSSDSSVSSVSSVPLVTQLQSGVLPSATHPTFWISSNAAASSEELFDRLNIEAKNSPLRPGATGATEGQAGEELSVTKTVSESGTGYLVTLDFGKSVKPMNVELTLRLSEQVHGLGRVADMITGPDETVVWQGTVEIGRLIMNTDKATYRRGDTAEVSLTLLDEAGSALCGSDIEALLYSPDGTLTERYSTSDGTLETRNCLNRTVGIEPDYEFKVKLAQEGMYELVVTEGKEGKVGKEGKEGKVGKEGKESKEGKVGDSDIAKTALKIQVVSNAEPFSITRKSITRTLGKDETMELDVYANETVVGKISEIVPGDVTISEVSVGGSIERSGDDQKITWEKILQAGTSTTVSYSFKVDSDPASSADFAEVRETRIETFGPAEIEGTEDTGGTEGTDVSKDNLNTSATSVTSVSSGSSLSINSSVGMMSGSILNGSGSSLPSLFSETGMTNSSDEAAQDPLNPQPGHSVPVDENEIETASGVDSLSISSSVGTISGAILDIDSTESPGRGVPAAGSESETGEADPASQSSAEASVPAVSPTPTPTQTQTGSVSFLPTASTPNPFSLLRQEKGDVYVLFNSRSRAPLYRAERGRGVGGEADTGFLSRLLSWLSPRATAQVPVISWSERHGFEIVRASPATENDTVGFERGALTLDRRQTGVIPLTEGAKFTLFEGQLSRSDLIDDAGHLKENEAAKAIITATTSTEDIKGIVMRELVARQNEAIGRMISEDSAAMNTVKAVIEDISTRRQTEQVADKVSEAVGGDAIVQTKIALAAEENLRPVVDEIVTEKMADEIIDSAVKGKTDLIPAIVGATDATVLDVAGKAVEQGVVGNENEIADAVLEATGKAMSDERRAMSDNSSQSSKLKAQSPLIQVKLRTKDGKTIAPNFHFEQGSVVLVVEPEREFTPGMYEVEVTITNPLTAQTQTLTQDFTWGVLAMNTNQDRYEAGDTAEVAIGVLDDMGGIVCDAELKLEIGKEGKESKGGQEGETEILTLSTSDNSIKTTGTCGTKDSMNVTPDYEAFFKVSEAGTYVLKLTAETENGTKEMTQRVSVDSATMAVNVTMIPPVTALQVENNQKKNGENADERAGDVDERERLSEVHDGKVGSSADSIATAATDRKIPENDRNINKTGSFHDKNAPMRSTAANSVQSDEATLRQDDSRKTSNDVTGVQPTTLQNTLSRSPVIISRKAATRLYPVGWSPMEITVRFNEDFKGTITDTVPGSFEISDVAVETPGAGVSSNVSTSTETPSGEKTISWKGSWKAGETATFSYLYDAPDVSPDFFTVGPLRLQSTFSVSKVPSVMAAVPATPVREVEKGEREGEKGESQIDEHQDNIIGSHGTDLEMIRTNIRHDTAESKPNAAINGWDVSRKEGSTMVASDTETKSEQISATLRHWASLSRSMAGSVQFIGQHLTTSLLPHAIAFEIPKHETVWREARLAGRSFTEARVWQLANDAADLSLTLWAKKRKITISNANVDENLTDFPLSVKITADADIGTLARSDGYDIRFASTTGALLKYEREEYHVSSGSGSGVFWVKIPKISGTTDTEFYIYYGRKDAGDGSSASSVWDSNFKGVWHLNQTSTGALSAADSTSNANNGGVSGATNATGKVDGAGSFDGSSNYIGLADTTSLKPALLTISAWTKPSSTTGYQNIFDRETAAPYKGFELAMYNGVWIWETNGSDIVFNAGPSTLGFNLLTVAYDGTNANLYYNGVLDKSQAQSAIDYSTTIAPTIGSRYTAGSGFMSGLLDEVRVSNIARSAAWIKFEYNNMNSAGQELTWEGEPEAEKVISGWPYKKKLTVSKTNVDSNLSNFPLYVKVRADSDLGRDALSTGYDIRFTTSTGVLLPYEREQYHVSSGSGSGDFWVKVPTVSTSSDTELYMYYGKRDATDGNESTNVWDSDFKGVWHLKETGTGTAGDYQDSTSNGNDSTNTTNQPTATSSGQVDGAESFDATDIVDIGASTSLNNLPAYTISAWFKTTSTSTYQVIFSKFGPSGYFAGLYAGRLFVQNNSSWTNAGNVVPDTNWHHMVATYDGTDGRIYLDSSLGQTAAMVPPSGYSGDGYISTYNGANFPMNGLLDDVRISATARSAAWIKFEYQNMSSATNEITWETKTNTLDGWTLRKPITISKTNVDSTLTDFPLYVKIRADADLGTSARSDGYDIRFATSTGVILPYEREDFHIRTGSGAGDFWVKVPRVSSTANTLLYMYYGKADAADGATSDSSDAAGSVWDSNFVGVWHLGQTSSGALSAADSTSNANNGGVAGATNGTGQVDGAGSFNGTSNFISLASTIDTSVMSGWSAFSWVNYQATGNYEAIFGGYTLYIDTSSMIASYDGTSYKTSTDTVSASTWTYVGFTCSSGQITFYKNGATSGTSAYDCAYADAYRINRIGSYAGTATHWYGGLLDESRVSSVARSAEWIKFEYQNMASGTNEITVGSSQSALITGTAYSDRGATPLAGKTVRIAVNGTDYGDTAETNASGQFTMSGASFVTGDILTFYMEDETQDAVTVMTASGGNMTGIDIYQDTLIVRNDSGGTLSNAGLATAAVVSESDISNIYSVTGNILATAAGKNLLVWANRTFTPGANVNVGSGVILRGTLTLGSNTATLSGAWIKQAAGTYTSGSGTVVLDGANQTLSGSTIFWNLTKSVTSAYTLSIANGTTQTIAGTLTLNGAANNRLSLRSTVSGSRWNLNSIRTRTISYLDVKDSNAAAGTTPMDASDGTNVDSGNNVYWGFGWYGHYTNRKLITIDQTNVDADLTDFPLLVAINADTSLGSYAQSDGDDIRFTTTAGAPLYYEREDYRVRSGSGSGNFWVRVPTIDDTTDTSIYVYYGSGSAVNGASRTNVWDSSFKGVWHLSGSTLSALDSTANGNNGTNNGATATTGQVDGGANFSGSAQYITVASDGTGKFDSPSYTLDHWFYVSSLSSYPILWSYDYTSHATPYYAQHLRIESNGQVFLGWNASGGTPFQYIDTPASTVVQGNWYHIVATYTSGSQKIYINGVQRASGTRTDTITYYSQPVWIGNSNFGVTKASVQDEVRFSSTARSAEWIKFEYNNMGNADHELSFGSTQTTVTGTAYSDEGVTPLASQTVRLAINGVDGGTAETNASGVYTLTGAYVSGDILTVYLEDETADAVTVINSSGTSLTGINLYQNELITRSDNSSPLTNANLATAAVSGETDISGIYAVAAGALTVASGKTLFTGTGQTLTPGGNVTAGAMKLYGTYNQGSSTLTVNGAFTQSAGTFNGGSGDITIASDLILSNGSFISTNGTLSFTRPYETSHTFTITNGTFNHNFGTVRVAGSWNYIAFASDVTLYNYTFDSESNSAVDAGKTVTIAGTLTLTNGILAGTGTFQAQGPVTVASTFDGGLGVLTINGSGDQSFIVSDGTVLPGIILNSANTTISFANNANASITTNLTLSNGTFISTNGTLSFTRPSETSHTFTITSGTFNHNSGTVSMTGSWNYITFASDVILYNYIADSESSTTVSSGKTVTILGALNLTNGRIYGPGTIIAKGDITVGASWLGGNAPLTLSGSSAQVLESEGGTWPSGTFTINKPSGTVTLSGALTLNTAGQDLALTSGTLNLNGNNLTVNDQFTIASAGTLRLKGSETLSKNPTSNAGTVNFSDSSTYSSLAAGNSYQNIVFSGSGLWKPSAALTVSGNLTIGTGSTFDVHGKSTTVTGTFENAGTFKLSGNETTMSLTNDTNSGLVQYVGTGSYTGLKAGNSYNNVTFNGAGGTWTLGSALTVNRNLTLSGGTLDASASNYGVAVAGNWTKKSAGGFTAREGTVTLNGTNQTMSGSTSFYNLTKTVASADTLTLAATTTQSLTGTLTLNGASTSNRLSLRSTLAGTRARILLASAGTNSLQYLDVQDSDAAAGSVLVCFINAGGCADSGNNTGWYFGVTGTGNILGNVWNDENGNGTKEAGEVLGLNNVTVNLTGNSLTGASISFGSVTTSTGSYAFRSVVRSNSAGYTVAVSTATLPAGYLRTTIMSSGGIVFGTGATKTQSFGLVAVNTLTGSAFIDLNGNRLKDENERGFSGTTIALAGTSATGNTLNMTARTNASGTYAFSGLPTSTGSWLVVAAAPSGYQTNTTDSRTITFGTGGQIKHEYFAYAAIQETSGGGGRGYWLYPQPTPSPLTPLPTGEGNGNTSLLTSGEGPGMREGAASSAPAIVIPMELAPANPPPYVPGHDVPAAENNNVAPAAGNKGNDIPAAAMESQAPTQTQTQSLARERRISRLAERINRSLEISMPTPSMILSNVIPAEAVPLFESIADKTLEIVGTLAGQAKKATLGVVGLINDASASALENISSAADTLRNVASGAADYLKSTARGAATISRLGVSLAAEEIKSLSRGTANLAKNSLLAVESIGDRMTREGAKLAEAQRVRGERFKEAVSLAIVITGREIRGAAAIAQVTAGSLANSAGEIASVIGNLAGQGLSGAGHGVSTVARGIGALADHSIRTAGNALIATDISARNLLLDGGAHVQNVISAGGAAIAKASESAGSTVALIAYRTGQEIEAASELIAAAYVGTAGGVSFIAAKTGELAAVLYQDVSAVPDRVRELANLDKETAIHRAAIAEPLQKYSTSIKNDRKSGKIILAALNLSVFDSFGNPYARTPVALFSTPKIAVTNDEGIATFHDVEAGEHRVEVAMKNGGTEIRQISIEPPSGIAKNIEKPTQVVLPVARVIVTESLHGAAAEGRSMIGIIIGTAVTFLLIGVGGGMYWVRRKKLRIEN